MTTHLKLCVFKHVLLYILIIAVSPVTLLAQSEFDFITSADNGEVIGIKPKPSSIKTLKSLTVDRFDPVLVADSYLEQALKMRPGTFGISDVTTDLSVVGSEKDRSEVSHVRYQILKEDVPVFGGQVVVHIAANGSVLSASGRKVTADTKEMSMEPVLSELSTNMKAKMALRKSAPFREQRRSLRKKIRRRCVRKNKRNTKRCTRRRFRKRLKRLRFIPQDGTKLIIYNKDKLANKSKGQDSLSYLATLQNPYAEDTERLIINAHSGAMLYREDGIRRLSREVWDCSPSIGACYLDAEFSYNEGGGVITDYYHGRSEGAPERGACPVESAPFYGSTDVDDFYETYIPEIHDYVLNTFGRDGGNSKGGLGDGNSIPFSVTRFFTNAEGMHAEAAQNCLLGSGWFGETSVSICTGKYRHDLMAHEYAHGFGFYHSFNPDNSFNWLLYQGEVGALEEANSDVLGQIYEFKKTGLSDWKVLNPAGDGFLRDLTDPPSVTATPPYPATYRDPNFYCGTDDRGGIHTNSVIAGKAAYLATEGGDFNGCTITGIGYDKVEQIWYSAFVNYFTQNETFNMAYNSYVNACDAFALTSEFGITAADCAELAKALQAVEMDKSGGCSGTPDESPATCADPPQPGDFNTDIKVDAADYMVWYDTIGATGASLAADANNDQIVDIQDCAIWKNNYGAGVCLPQGRSGVPCNSNPEVFAGDYDEDGDVDSDDYVVWMYNYSTTGAPGTLTADGNQDGSVDSADFALWLDNLGMGSCDLLSPVLNADLDADGDIDLADTTLLKSQYGQTGTGLAADLNGDEIVDTDDCQLLHQSYGTGLCPPLGIAGAPCAGTSRTTLSGDYDFDGDVDGSDFLAWQRGYGNSGLPAIVGDANNDGTVNGDDLAVWQGSYATSICAE